MITIYLDKQVFSHLFNAREEKYSLLDTVPKSVSALSSKKGPAKFGQSRQVCNFGCPNLKIPIDGFSSGAFSGLSDKDR